MAVGTGVTEIADSEEEPLTSSPAAVPDTAADKLPTAAGQDDQAVTWLHQDLANSIANEASSRTDGLDVDQGKPSSDVETAQNDHADLQPALEAGTNTTSACTTKESVQAAVCPPQASVGAFNAGHHTGGIDTDGTGGEASATQDTTYSPETGSPTQDTSMPTNTQVKWRDCQKDVQRPSLPEALPTNPVSSSQFETKANDSARFVNNQQDTSQGDAAVNHITKTGDAGSEAWAGRIQHDMTPAPSVKLPVSTATKRPYSNTDTETSVSSIGDTSGFMNLDCLPAGSDLTTPYTSSAQKATDVAATKPDVRDDRKERGILEPDSLAKCAAAPVSPTGSTDDYGMTGKQDFPRTTAYANTHEPRIEHQASIDTALGTDAPNTDTNADQSKQTPADTPAGQRPENRDVLEEGCIESEAERTLEPLIQRGVAGVHSHQGNDTKVEADSSLASVAPATHTQSQSSVSQTSEPASPRPAAKLTPQEITLAELKAQKAALLASMVALPAIQVLIEENQTSDIDMSDDDGEPTEADITAAANKMVKEHIKLLHEYNELKDVGQGLMGLIADQRGVRIVEVQDEFGLDAND